jgi:hypothetical protein
MDLTKLMGDQDHISQNLYAYVQGFSPAARDIFARFNFSTQIDKSRSRRAKSRLSADRVWERFRATVVGCLHSPECRWCCRSYRVAALPPPRLSPGDMSGLSFGGPKKFLKRATQAIVSSRSGGEYSC